MQQTNPELQAQRQHRQNRYKQKADKKTKQALDIIDRLKAKKQRKKLQQYQNIITVSASTSQNTEPQQQIYLLDLYFKMFARHSIYMSKDETAKEILEYVNLLRNQNKLSKNNDQIYLTEIKELERQLGAWKQKAQRQKQEIIQRLQKEISMLKQKSQAQQQDKLLIILKCSQQIEALTRQGNQNRQKINQMSSAVLSSRLENQSIANLERQIQKLNKKLNLSYVLQTNLKQQISELQQSSTIQKNRCFILESQIEKLSQQKINHLFVRNSSQEFLKLQNAQMRQNIEQLQRKNQELSKQITLFISNKNQIDSESQQHVLRLSRQVKDLQQSLQSEHNQVLKQQALNSQLNSGNKSSNELIYKQKKQLCLLQQEIIVMTQKLQVSSKQLTSSKSMLEGMSQISQTYTDLKLSHHELKQSYKQIKKYNQTLTDKIEELKKKIQKVDQQREEQLQAFQITIKNVQEGMDQERKEYDAQVACLKKQIDRLRKEIDKLRKQIDQGKSHSFNNQMENRQEIKCLQNKNKDLVAEIKSLETTIQQNLSEQSENQLHLKAEIQQFTTLKKQLSQSRKQNKQLKDQYNESKDRKSLQQGSLLISVQQQLAKQRQKYASSSSRLYEQIQSLNKEISGLRQNLVLKQSECNQSLRENDAMRQSLTKTLDQLNKQKLKHTQLQEQLTKENHRRIELQNQVKQTKNNYSKNAPPSKDLSTPDRCLQKQLQSQVIELKQKIEQIQKTLIEMDDLNSALTTSNSELKQQLQRQSQTSKLLTKDINKLQFQKQQLERLIQMSNKKIQQMTQKTSSHQFNQEKFIVSKTGDTSSDANGEEDLQKQKMIYFQQISPLKTEIDRLNNVLKGRQACMKKIQQDLDKNKFLVNNLNQQLESLRMQNAKLTQIRITKNEQSQVSKAIDNRHIKTIQHLTIELQSAQSEINSLKQSLMKKSNLRVDESLLNDSFLLDESFRNQDKTKEPSLKTQIAIKLPPKPVASSQRTNHIIQSVKATEKCDKGNIECEKTDRKESSKQRLKRNGSIKKIAGYFGF